MKYKKILLPVLILFLMYGCIKDDVVERDLLESVLVKAWYDSETMVHSPNFISKKEIKWDWEGAERTPNSLLIQSVESKDIRSFYKLEVSAVDGYEAVIYMYNPTAPSIDGSFTGREIAFGLDGEIIYSKFLRGTEDAKKSVPKRGLLATAARFSEGNNCNPGDWCFDDDLDAFVLDEVVVTFSQSSLNNANSITIIGWSSVLSYINNNTTSSNYYGNLPTTYSSGGGGTWNVVGTMSFNPNNMILGPKPLSEYQNKCTGIQNIWNGYPSNEVSGYITSDGKIIVTNIVSFSGGAVAGTYTYNGTTYYPYPEVHGAPSQNYSGLLHQAGYYFIPVVASFHTHSPCLSDGTDGTSHVVGNDDKTRAQASPNIRHWAIGCGSVAQFNGSNSSFFNKSTGNLSSICSNLN